MKEGEDSIPFEIVRKDIINWDVDGVVNIANPKPTFRPGMDSTLYQKAGPSVEGGQTGRRGSKKTLRREGGGSRRRV